MLTGNLLDYRRRSGRVLPRFLAAADAAAGEAAGSLLALANGFVGRPRGELEQALSDLAPPGLADKALRGLVKLILDESEFAAPEGNEPLALRRALFDGAARHWRERGAVDIGQWRTELLAAAASTHGIAEEDIPRAMFSDLPDEQLLLRAPKFSAVQLLHCYNVAQVQGLLLGAERLEIEAGTPAPQRLRQLLRYLKFFGLLFRLETAPADGELRLIVDGPLSVLEGGKGYGLNLAAFFPALLLWPPPWRLRAQVRLKTGPALGTHELIAEPDANLRSHYPDQGQWVPDAVKHFVERFNAQKTSWRAAPADDLIVLPGNRCLVPDFRLTHPDHSRPILVEHLLYPSPEAVQGKLALAAQVADARYVLACRALPSLKDEHRLSPRVHLYRRQLLAPVFLEWIERPDGAGLSFDSSVTPR